MYIHIQRLAVPIYIGVTLQERNKIQNIYISLKINININPEIKNDKIKGTVDYRKISIIIKKTVALRKWILMENLASHIIQEILNMDDKIIGVEATLEKRNTQSYQLAEYISVILSNKELNL